VGPAGVRASARSAELGHLLETNLFGPLLLTRAFALRLVAAKGAVINVASVLSWLAWAKGYSISKAALWSATEGLRLELEPQGVQVVGAYLAFTDTPMNDGLADRPMNDPADVVAAIYDGLRRGHGEVLADDTTRAVRAGLSRVANAA
jgi:NAD(P)-dependent dehydrogenase (short-subunit alcohol dehydrogenase family)